MLTCQQQLSFLLGLTKLANDPLKVCGCDSFALRLTSAAVPGKPVDPQCDDTAKGSITLSWEPPTDDGGKPITGYVVEKRQHGSDKWTKYVSPLSTTTLHVNFSVRLSLRQVVCGRIFTGSCRFTLIWPQALIKTYHCINYDDVYSLKQADNDRRQRS